MNRLLVALLSAFDAVIAIAVGVVCVLAPLTLLWVTAGADWSVLWPATAVIWQLGHLVPAAITLEGDFIADSGLPADAASFAVSLAPLAFAAFTLVFAVRSGRRAAGAGAWLTGVVTGVVTVAVLAALVALTGRTAIAAVQPWLAVLLPTAVYATGVLCGAVVAAWRDGDDGIVDRLHDRVDAMPAGWRELPALALRGTAIVLLGLLTACAVLLALDVVLRGGEMIALFERARVDVLGVAMITLGQLAYLPTLLVWTLSWIAGPGFALGTGTAVSPAGTQLGVVPGVPVLGLLPEQGTPWLLLVALIPIAAGALAAMAVRSTLPSGHELAGLRAVLALAIAVLSGAVAALLALCASGSIGPGRLAHTGPEPGPFALALGLEVLVGAAVVLLAPRRDASRADAVEAEEAAVEPVQAAELDPH